MEIWGLSVDCVEFWGQHDGNKGGMRISWSANIGFGQLEIVKTKDNELIAFTERMDGEDKSFTANVLSELMKKLTVVD